MKAKALKIETSKEWSEALAAWLVTCRVNGALYNAKFTCEPDATSRALAYEAASAF